MLKLARSIRDNKVALDSSDTGTGKTVMSLTIAEDLGLTPFVLCPKSVVPSWREHGEKMGVLTIVNNYEKLRTGRTEYVKKKGQRFDWYLDRDRVLLVFDEVHRCKGSKSLQSKLLAAAKRQGFKILMLSATAFQDPTEMRAIGYALNLHDYKGWWNWCRYNGCKQGDFGGMKFNGSERILSDLHASIYFGEVPMGSRISIKDLPKGSFPDTLITAEGYSVADISIEKIYEEMKDELEGLAEQEKLDDEDNALVIQLRARQKIELIKVPLLEELVHDSLARNSVVVFLNFKDSLDALGDRLSSLGTKISVIEGDQSSEVRDQNIKDFQSNKSRVMLCMTQAGGTGLSLHDETGDFPRVSLISPSFSAVDLRQCLGRVHRASSKTPSIQKIIFANDTVEMKVCRSIRKKLNNLDMVNDNEMNPIL